MRRTGWITALTVAGIVVAAGTAAALNARVLDSAGSGSVGTAETFVELDEQPADEPTTSVAPTSATPSATPASPSARPASPSARPTSSSPRPASSSSSQARPSSSASDDSDSSGKDDSDGRDDSSGKGSGSDDEPDDD